jgi:large conductance mechanosensitive channel
MMRVNEMGFWQEFKAFALKGNMIDLAVAVVIGGAFGKIISSLVSDIIMPPLGLLIGGVNFSDLKYVLKGPAISAGGLSTGAVTINYGNFLNAALDFFIIALSIFGVIKVLSKLERKEAKKAPTEPPPTHEEALLSEIRDLLKEDHHPVTIR